MKCAVLSGEKTISLEDRPKPKPGSEEIVIDAKACGICGTDLHGYLHGKIIPTGTIMGHELSGIVDDTGSEVTSVKPGDRVVVHPAKKCLQCFWCVRGQMNLCGNSVSIGLSPEHDGGFAEYVRIPSERMLFPFPDSVSFEQGALTEPLATAYHAVRISRFKPGDTVLVVGAGPIGIAAIQFLRIGGAGRIVALEIAPERRDIALRAGADLVFDPIQEGSGLISMLRDITDGVGFDSAFECSGVPAAIAQSLYHIRRGGQYILTGISDKDTPLNTLYISLSEIDIMGSFGSRYFEFQSVIMMMEKGMIDTDLLITDCIALEDIEKKGFKRLTESKDVLKIIVNPK